MTATSRLTSRPAKLVGLAARSTLCACSLRIPVAEAEIHTRPFLSNGSSAAPHRHVTPPAPAAGGVDGVPGGLSW